MTNVPKTIRLNATNYFIMKITNYNTTWTSMTITNRLTWTNITNTNMFANRFICININNTNGFTCTNTTTESWFTWTNRTSINGFIWTNIIANNWFTWMKIKSNNMFTQTQTLLPQIGLPGLTELAMRVLIGRTFLLLMSLTVWTKLALTCLLGGITNRYNTRQCKEIFYVQIEICGAHHIIFVAVWDFWASDSGINCFQNRFSMFKITFFN